MTHAVASLDGLKKTRYLLEASSANKSQKRLGTSLSSCHGIATSNVSMTMKTNLCTVILLPLIFAGTSSQAENARYVRVEIPGSGKTLTLAEVEVFSSGKNIARKGKATQSATAYNGPAEKAIDGNKSPVYGDGGQTHTPNNSTDPWWELDLGQDVDIEQIDIYNRGETFTDRLDGFSLILKNSDGKEVFRRDKVRAPDSAVSFAINKKGKIRYLTVKGNVASEQTPPEPVPDGYRDPSPFQFQQDDIVAIIGNGLADRMQHDAWLETYLQAGSSGKNLTIRNLSLSGDQVDKFPRSKGFTSQNDYLKLIKADVILAFFGYNESFAGVEKADDYRKRLVSMVQKFREVKPNGKDFPRFVLFSPIAFENHPNPNLPRSRKHNQRLAAYAVATQKAADELGVKFVDLYNPSLELYQENDEPLTINGVHLNEKGNHLIAKVIAHHLVGEGIPANVSIRSLREAVKDKNWHWHNRYRATDGNDVWGGRSGLRFVDNQSNAEVLQHELTMIDVMTANRDKQIWAVAGGNVAQEIDDSNVPPPIQVKSNVGGKSKSSNAQKEGSTTYQSGEQVMEGFTVPMGFEVNLFADEKQFPQLANPVQLQVDAKGRLWAASWNTYPKWEPLKEMNDALLIFEDTNKDGRADKVIRFAEVHNPLGFEFWNGGVIVTQGPDLLFLKDTDGDDKADVRYVLLLGFGTSDTHHAANNLIYGPDGAVYWQSGIFLVHNHEHPWGPSLQTGASAMYRFDPRRFTISVHAGNSPNPHGIAFDRWGYHYANDGTGGRSYQVRPEGKGFKMHTLLNKQVRPVPADEIVSSSNFPESMQGNFLICNTIGFLGIKNYKLHREGFDDGKKKAAFGEVWGTPEEDLLVSKDRNFRPTDCIFGEDGALYIADWQNVIIGHMQHNIRDPNRDKKHGRIYRMIYRDRPLQRPVAIAGASIEDLLNNLKHPINGVRQRTRVELSARDPNAVIAATRKWMNQFDPGKKEDAHSLLEALWVHQQFNERDEELLETVLNSPEQHARIAAQTVKHHWTVADSASGGQSTVEEEEVVIKKSGILKQGDGEVEIRINTVQEQMRYDIKELTVKAGSNVTLHFANPDFMPHNLLVVQPGTADEIGMAAINLGAEGFKKQFIPESDKIIAHTRLVDHNKEETITFTLPEKTGDYQYVCTFPGHHFLMRGTLKVR